MMIFAIMSSAALIGLDPTTSCWVVLVAIWWEISRIRAGIK